MTDTLTLLGRTTSYQKARIETQKCYADYCAASAQLERAHSVERNAELASQCFESIDRGKLKETLGEITDREREIGLAFARYAIFGRTDKA